MQRTLRFIATLLFLLVSSFCLGQSSSFQDSSMGPPPASATAETDPQFRQRRDENAETMRRMEREREKQVNKERMLKIKRDTDKLLALATELKQYVDKTNENVLSVDVIRKAEEIEKLAHSVREKMKE